MSIRIVELWEERKFRLLFASILLVAVFEVLSLGGYHLPDVIAIPLFLIVIVIIGKATIASGVQALLRLRFQSISLLMVIAVIGAFFVGEYEEAAIVVVLFTLGEYLEDVGIESSRSALRRLIEQAPKTAMIKGEAEETPIERIPVGSVVVIRPGDLIPLDATIQTGESSVDESTITGEPIPKDKHTGDTVFAGTLNMHGFLEVIVTKAAKDSTLSKIIDLTFQAGKTKAATQKFIEKFSRFYTPSILVVAILLVAVPTLALGKPFESWFREALTLLVIACPCALVISTPVSIYSAIGNASSKGVVIKGGKYVEELGRIKAIALDKTRTITHGKPIVTDVLPSNSVSREHLLACAAGIEQYSEHPLAKAVVEAAQSEKLDLHSVELFQAVFGKGATAECLVCYDREHAIGKLKWIAEQVDVKDSVVDAVEKLQAEGKTAMVVGGGKSVEGIIAVTDAIKDDSALALKQIRALGVEPVMLTGDNHVPASVIASKVGITDVRAELLPEDKVAQIDSLREQYGTVAMVGDGVNDAPALARASVGIAMGASGSDAAIESAHVAILNDKLSVIPFLIQLGRKTLRTIRINTILAVSIKLLFIGLALAGVSNLALAIFADVGVTLIVIMLSLRLMNFSMRS